MSQPTESAAVGFVTNPTQAEHGVADHSESPQRIEAVLALLRESGLWQRLHRLEPRDATDEELRWVHPPAYLEGLRRACAQGGGWADMDTYILPRSCAAAWQAAGACLEATEAVLAGRVRAAFCAVRPPGHHARPQQAMGFCLLNNVAVMAQYARHRHGLERVAIVDIDVHHGNGTQDRFYDDPGVLYVSTHQYPYYPGTGAVEETGAAHAADPLALMELSVDGYGELATRLRALADELCEGRIVFVLEGGYDLVALSWCVRRVLEVLLGESPTPDPLDRSTSRPEPDIGELLADLRHRHGLA
jgi:acetoin utilization deacetylase AcuC-like enzyme